MNLSIMWLIAEDALNLMFDQPVENTDNTDGTLITGLSRSGTSQATCTIEPQGEKIFVTLETG